MKLAIALIASCALFAGCAFKTHVEIQRANVPQFPWNARSPCRSVPLCPRKAWPQPATLNQFAQAAMAVIERREGYEGEHLAARENCRKLVKPIQWIRESSSSNHHKLG